MAASTWSRGDQLSLEPQGRDPSPSPGQSAGLAVCEGFEGLVELLLTANGRLPQRGELAA